MVDYNIHVKHTPEPSNSDILIRDSMHYDIIHASATRAGKSEVP